MCIIVSTNPTKRISFEEVRQCPELCHLTDEQAIEVAETIKLFTEIVYRYASGQLNKEQSGKILELPNQKNKAA